MKAPDKIYLIERDPEDISIAWYDDSEINRELTTNDRKLAYIRKDALLELLKEEVRDDPHLRYEHGWNDALDELLEKLQEL